MEVRASDRSLDPLRWNREVGDPLPYESISHDSSVQFPISLEFLEEQLGVIIGDAQDRSHFSGCPVFRQAQQVHDGPLRGLEDLSLEVRIDLPQHVLEHLPRLPSVQPRRRLTLTDREGRESADLEAFAFLAVPLERLLRAAVFERFAEGLHVETGLSRDIGLDLDAVDGSGVEAP